LLAIVYRNGKENALNVEIEPVKRCFVIVDIHIAFLLKHEQSIRNGNSDFISTVT
jgi:hypothetical protein